MFVTTVFTTDDDDDEKDGGGDELLEIEHVALINENSHGVHCIFIGPETVSMFTVIVLRAGPTTAVIQPCI
jgi:hypothetical protein